MYGTKKVRYQSLTDHEQVARVFLIDNRNIFKMKDDLSDLAVLRKNELKGTTIIDFQQSYKGIPVFGGEYTIGVNAEHGVYMAAGKYYNTVTAPTNPALNNEQALKIAAHELGLNASDIREPLSELVIYPYPDEDKYVLAYHIGIHQWEMLVNSIDGRIELKYERVQHVNGIGNVYQKDPVNSSITTVTLPRLVGQGTKLIGTYVKVINAELGEAYSASRDFRYWPPYYSQHDNTHFDDANVYYHIDKFAHTYWPDVGFPGLGFQIQATMHTEQAGPCEDMGHDNAGRCPVDGNLYFGHGEIIFWDLSKKDDVIYHEYTHAVSAAIGLRYVTFQESALNEAYSDYHTATFTNDPRIGEWVTRCTDTGDLRIVSNNPNIYHYSDISTVQYAWCSSLNKYLNPAGSPHAVSMIFSGALWDLRQEIGNNTITNFLVYEGLRNKHHSGVTFLDAREGLIIADQQWYGGQHVNTIKNVLAARGIGQPAYPSPPYITLNASGPHPVLNWSAVGGANSYNIYYGAIQGAPGTVSCSMIPDYGWRASTTSTTFTDYMVWIDPEMNILACYYVTSVNQYGESVPSNEVGVHGMAPLRMDELATAETITLPTEYAMHDNYPNPFNPSTTIRYDIPKPSLVSLIIYDIMGREVRRLVDEIIEPGYHQAVWDARNDAGAEVSSGVYIYRFTARPVSGESISEGIHYVRRMVYVR
jgi:Zn-dependent metalloprotease